MSKTSRLFCILTVGIALSISAPLAVAQDDDPTYMWVFLTTVKSDRVAEFEELLKQRAAGLKATGEGFRSVYQSVVGDQYTYMMADYISAIEVLDTPQPDRAPPPTCGLLAMIPTGQPSKRPSPVVRLRANRGCSSKNEPSSRSMAMRSAVGTRR